MPRPAEIDYYARLIAALMVTAARAKTNESLARVYVALGDVVGEILTVVSHDAGALQPDMADDLLVQAAASVDGHQVVKA